MLGVDPMKMALDGAKKKVMKIDLNHNNKPDVIELKEKIDALEKEVHELEHIAQLIEQIKHDNPEIAKEIQDYLSKHLPVTMQNPKVKEILSGATRLASLQPKIMEVVNQATSLAGALGVD